MKGGEDMNKKITKSFVWWMMILSVTIGLIPWLINVIGTNLSIKSGADFGDWLGFWGSYLGGFLTLLGVYLAFYLNRKQSLEGRLLDRYDSVASAKVWCLLLIMKDRTRYSEDKNFALVFDSFNKFFSDVATISKEFNVATQEAYFAKTALQSAIKSYESGEVDKKEMEEVAFELKEKARELLNLIDSIEGSSILYNSSKKYER